MQLINENTDKEYSYFNDISCIGYYQTETKKYYYTSKSECEVHIKRMQKDGWRIVETKEKTNISSESPKLVWYVKYVKNTIVTMI